METKLLKSKPPQLSIEVEGQVPSTGWSAPWIYIVPPQDGILSLSFFAKAPTGPAGDALTDITATAKIAVPSWVKGVRVHASQNAMEDRIGEPVPPYNINGGDSVPWPWFAGK